MNVPDREIADFVKERARILEEEDMPAFRKCVEVHAKEAGLPPPSDFVVEEAFHKARYEATSVSRDKRLASGRWLTKHDMARIYGSSVLPNDKLPE